MAGHDGVVAGSDDGGDAVRRHRLPAAARAGFDRTDRRGRPRLRGVLDHHAAARSVSGGSARDGNGREPGARVHLRHTELAGGSSAGAGAAVGI